MLSALINLTTDWAAWILLTSTPSLLNMVIAVQDLQRKSNRLPFFNPYLCLGFWTFCLVQLLLPAFAFWLFFSIDKKPSIDPALYIKAGLFGIGFNTFINNSTQIGPIKFDIKPFYDLIIGISIDKILSKETSRTAIFWLRLKTEFSNSSTNFQLAIDFLTHYVKSNAALDDSLKSSTRDSLTQEYEKLIATAKRKKVASEKANAIVSAISQIVKRRDLPDALRECGCTQTLDEFFGKKS